MLQLMNTAERKKASAVPRKKSLGGGTTVPPPTKGPPAKGPPAAAEVPRRNRSTSARRRQSAQLYRQYVGKSSIFEQNQKGRNGQQQQQHGRWPPVKQNGTEGPMVRTADSTPSPAQLEWQRQRRAKAMSASGASTSGGFATGQGGIVQRHAEMRSYLQHCQRVLNARPRVDSSLPRKRHSTATPSPASSAFSSGGTRELLEGNGAEGGSMGTGRRYDRAKSVPAIRDHLIREENERLLDRLIQIGTRTPPPLNANKNSSSEIREGANRSSRRQNGR